MKVLLQNQLVNRDDAKVDIEDRGYQFGDGVYEVIKVYDGKPFYFGQHLERLISSAKKIRLELPFSLEELKISLQRLVQENKLQNGHIYLQITRGKSDRVHQFPLQSEPTFTAYTKETKRPITQQKDGIKVILSEDIRWLRCDIKSLNLLANVLAKQEAIEKSATEAIFHRGNTITEGSSSNIFVVNQNGIYTHPKNNYILPGITRDICVDIMQQLGLELHEEAFTVNDLLHANEVFITSTTMEITPVVKVDEQVIGDGVPGQITKTMQAKFEHVINQL